MLIYQSLTINHTVNRCEGNIVSDMDGEKVMLSVNKGKYYNMGLIGGEIWDEIGESTTVKNLIENLSEKFEVQYHTCEEHVISFLEQLLIEDLIEASIKTE